MNGTGAAYSNQQSVKNLTTAYNGIVNLYAQWQLITRNIEGNVTWNDENNQYGARPQNVTVTLTRTPTTGAVTNVPAPKQVAGNANYAFNGVQTYDTTTGGAYQYSVSQNSVTGYRTTISGYNIVNDLIKPTYTSNLSYEAIDTYNNQYLKNGKVKIKGVVQNTNNTTYPELGLNSGIVTLKIDSGIQLDESTLKIYYTNTAGVRKQVNAYSITGNNITINFGEAGISKIKDKLEVEIIGTAKEIKQYSSNIKLTGNLRAYNGENTNISLGELTKKEAGMTVTYQMPKAKIRVIKKDSITEENLNDAIFTLYEWNGKEYIEKESLKNNGDGTYESSYYEWNVNTQGKYKIEETGIPENHIDLNFLFEYTIDQLKTENYTIMPDYDNGRYHIGYNPRNPDNFSVSNGIVENEPYKVKAKLEKIDSETKKQIVADTEFTIYEWNKEKEQYEEYVSKIEGQKVSMQRQQDGTYQSSEWLYYTKNNEGKYRIIETKAPKGYYGDYKNSETKEKNTYDINIVEIVKSGNYKGQTVGNESTINIENNGSKLENKRVKNKIEVTKIDSQNKTSTPQGDAKLEGTVYELYARENILHADGVTSNYEGEQAVLYKTGELIDTQTINKEGKLTFENLESGKYYIKEKTAGEGYLVDETEYEIDATYQNEETIEIIQNQTIEEKVKKQKIQIVKLNQKEETEYEELEKAGFSIYQISQLSIVQEGKIERITKDRYKLLDKEALKDKYITSKEQKDGTYKLSDLIDYYYKMQYKEGYEQELPNNGEVYYPYHMEEESLVINYENSHEGEPIQEQTTGKDGKIVTPELAYGEYIMIETSVPLDYQAAKPFIISIEEDSREAQNLRYIVDPNFEAKVKIYKVDTETKQSVLRKEAKYVIRNVDTGELVTQKTWKPMEGYVEQGSYEHPYEIGEEGYLITEVALGIGNYEIEEIEAPEGYTINGYEGSSNQGETIWNKQGNIQFEVNGNTAYHIDEHLGEIVIVQKQENKAQVGSLKIETQGEYLKEIITNNDGSVEIKYEKGPIQGVSYQIIANEDIISQDGQTTLYPKGEIVRRVTTNQEGIGYAENLPLGNYIIKQTKAGEGFALDTEEENIEITYGTNQKELETGSKEWKQEAQKTPVVFHETRKENQRQKLEIEIQKQDGQTNEPLEGAIFGIYAKENIVGKEGQVIIAKDTLVEKVTSNQEGTIRFNQNLPLGNYYIKEEKAPQGYVKKQEQIQIDGTYQQDQREKIQISKTYQNEKTEIYVEKITTQQETLEGVKLQIQDDKGNIVEEWETKKDQHGVKGLENNKEYKLIEVEPAKGYVTAEEIHFTIEEKGTIQGTENNLIQMIDETTKLEIELLDKDTKEKLEGVNLEIYKVEKTTDEEGNETIEEGEKVRDIQTTKDNYYTEKLEIGEYIIRQPKEQKESLLDKGYVTLEDTYFRIEDKQEIQKVTLEQGCTKLEVEVLDKDSKGKLEGVVFEIYKVEKTTDEEGNETIEVGEKVRDFTTSKDNYTTQRLVVGEYILRQPKEQKESLLDKGYVTLEDTYFRIEDKQEIQKVTLEQGYTKLEVELLGKDTKGKLEGVEFEIYQAKKTTDEEGNETIEVGEKIRDFTTSKDNYTTQKLAQGEYILRQPKEQKESLLNKGYVTLEDTYFTIEDKQEIQKVELEQDYTKVEISLLDKDTLEAVIGGTLVVTNKEGKEITENWLTNGKPHPIRKLPVGEYYLEEKAAPTLKGYVRTEKITFQVEETVEPQKVEMLQDYTRIEIKPKDEVTGDDIGDIELVIKDEKGKEIDKITITKQDDIEKILDRLPVGEYTVESSKVPYGYKQVNATIKVKNKQGIQSNNLTVEREEFDLSVETWIQEIKRNGTVEYTNTKQEQTTKKVDIKDKKIGTEQIEIKYKIKVSNQHKIAGQVGKIEVGIPNGMQFEASKNKTYWKEEGGKIVTTDLAGREIKEGQEAQAEITLTWKNGLENFGTKRIGVEIQEVTSDIGFKETNKENNKAESEEVIIGVSTGEMNLVYACWVLLGILILIEIIISRKTKIKKFEIKDKTLKYRQ